MKQQQLYRERLRFTPLQDAHLFLLQTKRVGICHVLSTVIWLDEIWLFFLLFFLMEKNL